MELRHSFPNSGSLSAEDNTQQNSSICSPKSNSSSTSFIALNDAFFRNGYAGDTWPMLEGLTHVPPPAYPLVPDEPLQMLHLRFPTPPITPPYAEAAATTPATPTTPPPARPARSARPTTPIEQLRTATSYNTASPTSSALRTESVIMKISAQELYSPQTPQQDDVDMSDIDIVNLDVVASNNHNNNSNSNNNNIHAHSRLRDHLITTATNTTTLSSTSSASSSPKRGEYICEWLNCGRDHLSLDALAAHVTKVHAVASPADGLYYCRWRGCTRARGFSARYKMLVHARTHTKEKPHQCHLCSKCFSRAENLKIHIRSHSGEKPYLCTYEGCHKAYSNSSDRFKHTRTHAMDRPYMCKVPGCQKRYTDPSSLRKHVKTFKHAIQLIGTAAITPTASNSNGNNTNSATMHELDAAAAPSSNVTPVRGASADAALYREHTTPHDVLLSGYQRYADVDMAPTSATLPLPLPIAMPAPLPMTLCQLCVQPHYYLHGMDEDLCKEATQLDYYYAAHAQTTPPRSHSASGYWMPHAQFDAATTDSAMDLEIPLDLRVHRS